MIILLTLSLHLFLISLYAIAIDKGVSRLQMIHLLYALCIPVVGELSLLITEFGLFKSSEAYVSPLTPPTDEAQQAAAHGEMTFSEEITREELLQAIKRRPQNLPQLLKRALRADDSEVVHIAAANIMRIQRAHEAELSRFSREYEVIPEDMKLLQDYIASIDSYLDTELLEGESRDQLIETKRSLLESYRRTMPNDRRAKKELEDTKNTLHERNM